MASSSPLLSATRLLNRDFVLLWQGQFASQLGNAVFLVAMMLWTTQATGSASLVGLLMMGSTVPAVLLGPVAGTLADRHSRKWIIVVSDAGRGAGMLGLAWLFVTRAEATELLLSALFAFAIFDGSISSVFGPAIGASVPDLVPGDRVASANSLMQISSQGSAVLGQAAGGMVIRVLGAPGLFLVDGLSYLLSALLGAWIRIPQRVPERSRSFQEALLAYRRDARDGFRFVWKSHGMRAFLVLTAGFNFLSTPLFVLLPFYARDTLGSGAAWYGFLLAAFSGGSLVGMSAAGALCLTGTRRAQVLLSAFLITPLGLAALGTTASPALAAALMSGMGLFTGMLNIYALTLIQLATPRELRGRVMALVLTLVHAATPAGMALGGLLGDMTGRDFSLVFGLFGLTALFVVAAMLPGRSLRAFLALELADASTGHAAGPHGSHN